MSHQHTPAKSIRRQRRALLAMMATAPALAACSQWPARTEPDFAAIERLSQGRIGVAALDLATGRSISHRGNERFALCSTFKALLAGLVLQRVDANTESLARRIAFGPGDLVVYSPLTQSGAQRGSMNVGELCRAAVSHSDNTAANLLLATLGGPQGFTRRLRELGDAVTRLDRIEPDLNENVPGDVRDTSTPLAMLESLRRFLFSDLLSAASRDILRGWMIATPTGATRLRAGIPAGWVAGDKTGTSRNNQNNDVAFALPPADVNAGPILIVSFINAPEPFSAKVHALHARIGSEVFGLFL